MGTTRLSTKGQIVLPREIRVARDWKPGMEFTVEETGDGVLLRPARRFPETTLDQVVGCLRYKGKRKTLAEMDEGVARAIKERHDRGRY
jgi:AbrB family looped-hinge helix DNA binding protein